MLRLRSSRIFLPYISVSDCACPKDVGLRYVSALLSLISLILPYISVSDCACPEEGGCAIFQPSCP
jgi:hypothetical protein